MLNTTNNTSLKDYYIKLEKMYEQAVNMLTAISQSLTTAASEITINIADSDDAETTIRIPSFLYLENKLEELDSNMSTLFNMPKSGEAWFEKTSNMYKLKMVKAGSAPLTPTYVENPYASITDNNFLKDLVSPRTYLKLRLNNVPDNINQILMKKIVIYDSDIFSSLNNSENGYNTYEGYKAALYGKTKGVDYDEYDTVLDMPVKADKFKSSFGIISLKENDINEPDDIEVWSQEGENGHQHVFYRVHLVNNNLDTYIDSSGVTHYTDNVYTGLTYSNQEDSSEQYQLKEGDKLTLANTNVIYNVSTINTGTDEVILEEIVGHAALQTSAENSAMEFILYNADYSEYKYVNVPLEENRYIACFFAALDNNVRSLWSNVFLFDMSTILMYDEYGNVMRDETGAQYTYLEYYKKYCTNIGDLLAGIVKVSEPQVTNYSVEELNELQNGENIQTLVTNTIDNSTICKIIPINQHLIDDSANESIVNLHKQKNEIISQLESINTNISDTYNTLVSTDFSQEVSITQSSLKAKLTEYYNTRTELQKQKSSIISQINTVAATLNTAATKAKYRIRGITNINSLSEYISNISELGETSIIQLEVEYKYKTTDKDTTKLTTINGNTFTDWNRIVSIERHRSLSFNSNVNGYTLEYDNYLATDNVIKWNQIDVPIQSGEDVVIRIRYKYNVGQPFIDIYTPWSDEISFTFPAEYVESIEVTDILSQNETDATTANFESTLINDGISEHVSNKIADASQTFYHMPENIYSGFNTETNSLISLKDKLTTMDNELTQYKEYIVNEVNQKYEVYLEYEGTNILLSTNTTNRINLFSSENSSNTFTAIDMNIIIKNTGDIPVKFYSIFPGKVDTPLILTSLYKTNENIKNYERVPLIENNLHTAQTLGQWIYFRQNNAYTNNNIYEVTYAQNENDNNSMYAISKLINKYNIEPYSFLNYSSNIKNIMVSNYRSVLYGYRRREINRSTNNVIKWKMLDCSNPYEFIDSSSTSEFQTLEDIYNKFNILNGILPFTYVNFDDETETNNNLLNNNWLIRFEDIYGLTSKNKLTHLDDSISITDFISLYNVNNFSTEQNYTGAFLYPNINAHSDIITDGTDQGYIKINTSKTLSIPIRFEYYLDSTANTDINKITKALYFDLKDSLITEIDNYMIEVTINYNNSASVTMFNNVAEELSDSMTE